MSTAGQHKIKVSCDQFLDQLNEFVDCEVDEELKEALEAHSSKCRHCYVIYDEVRKTVKVYSEAYSECEPLKTDVRERLVARLACGPAEDSAGN